MAGGTQRLDHRFILFDNFVVEPLQYTDGLAFGGEPFNPAWDASGPRKGLQKRELPERCRYFRGSASLLWLGVQLRQGAFWRSSYLRDHWRQVRDDVEGRNGEGWWGFDQVRRD